MTIKYQEVIIDLDVNPQDREVVAEVKGYLHGRDSETDNSYTCPFIIPLEFKEAAKLTKDFIPYEGLSKEVVSQWVTERISETDRKEMEKIISDKLAVMRAKPEINDERGRALPW